MTRYFYDTEFLEDGNTINLISIGIVADDGREYYAVCADMDTDRINKHKWLMENVWPHLPLRGRRESTGYAGSDSPGVIDTRSALVRPKYLIRNEVRDFILGGAGDHELWAYFGAYDHVALAQLFGPMISLPDGIPMFTNDIKQLEMTVRRSLPPQPKDQHDALADARWVRDAHKHLTKEARP